VEAVEGCRKRGLRREASKKEGEGVQGVQVELSRLFLFVPFDTVEGEHRCFDAFTRLYLSLSVCVFVNLLAQ